NHSQTTGGSLQLAGTLILTFLILTRWRLSLHREMSNSRNQSRILMTACVASRSRTRTATSYSLVALGHKDAPHAHRWTDADRPKRVTMPPNMPLSLTELSRAITDYGISL